MHRIHTYSHACIKYTPHTHNPSTQLIELPPPPPPRLPPLLQSQTEEGIKKELLSLQEDKHNYETTAKESLRRVLQEKIEVVRKLAEVEVNLHTQDI